MSGFDDSLRIGRIGEQWLDEFFGGRFNIRKGSNEDDRRGIDRWFYGRDHDPIAVQYKFDNKTQSTGNVAIEIGSVGPRWHQNGCTWTTEAYVVIYSIPGYGVFSIRRDKFQEFAWDALQHNRYPIKASALNNDGYVTLNICVPVGVFIRQARKEAA